MVHNVCLFLSPYNLSPPDLLAPLSFDIHDARRHALRLISILFVPHSRSSFTSLGYRQRRRFLDAGDVRFPNPCLGWSPLTAFNPFECVRWGVSLSISSNLLSPPPICIMCRCPPSTKKILQPQKRAFRKDCTCTCTHAYTHEDEGCLAAPSF